MSNSRKNTDPVAYQQHFFSLITNLLGNKNIIPALCEVLHLNKSAIYKRINGEKLLTLDEFLLLSDTFNISHQLLSFSSEDQSVFQFDQLSQKVKSCREYLELIVSNFSEFGRFSDLKIWFATTDLPLFYISLFKELALFKMFTFARVNWELPYTLNLDFNPDSFPEKEIYYELLYPIGQLYASIPSIEIWTDELYTNTAKQIRHFAQNGQISNPQVVSILFEQLEALADLHKEMATTGTKFLSPKSKQPAANLDLYYNQISASNMVIILGESQFFQGTYMVFDDPNYLFISDEKFYKYASEWLKAQRQKSIRISQEGAFIRNNYFRLLCKRIEQEKALL
ncbi:MAG: hypothetical protein R2792_14960 [Saprospiraceae bacterium]